MMKPTDIATEKVPPATITLRNFDILVSLSQQDLETQCHVIVAGLGPAAGIIAAGLCS